MIRQRDNESEPFECRELPVTCQFPKCDCDQMADRSRTLHIDALIMLTLEILKMKPHSKVQQDVLKFLVEQRAQAMTDLVDGYPEDMRGEIDTLRAEIERLTECLDTMNAGARLHFDERKELRAEIDRLRAIEDAARQAYDHRLGPLSIGMMDRLGRALDAKS